MQMDRGTSVTIFGEILPLWRNNKSLAIFACLFNIWQNCEPTLANFYAIGEKFIVAKGQIL